MPPTPDTGYHEFTVVDRDGNPHEYGFTEHPAGEGLSLMLLILSLGAPTLASLAAGALASEKVIGIVTDALSDGDEVKGAISTDNVGEILALFAELDTAAIGAAITAALGSPQALPVIRATLKYATRDGKPVPAGFDRMYQANYVEAFWAFQTIARVNGFFPGLGTSRS